MPKTSGLEILLGPLIAKVGKFCSFVPPLKNRSDISHKSQDPIILGGWLPTKINYVYASNEKRAPSFLGDLLGMKSYTVKWGLFHKPL